MARDNGGIIGVTNNPTSSTASGVWDIDSQYQARVGDNWPATLFFSKNSLRFNSASTDYLSRTMASVGNMQAWTVSVWVKRSELSGQHMIFSAYNNSSNNTECFFEGSGQLNFRDLESGSFMFQKKTTQLFRDTSAWYHLVFSSASGAQKIYVNGVEVTSFATDTNGSGTSTWNNDKLHTIGVNSTTSSDKFGGYMSELISVDGQTLTPSSFGQLNSDGVWTPKKYAGTYGTNGFLLQFGNSAALGTDSSSNGLNFAATNLTSIDQSTDYPEVNFATFNPLFPSVNFLSQGNLELTNAASSWKSAYSTIAVTKGKWYFELKVLNSTSDNISLGVCEVSQSLTAQYLGFTNRSYSYNSNGYVYTSNNSVGSQHATYGQNDIIGCAVDFDNNKIYFHKNGTYINSGDPTSGATGTGSLFNMTDGYDYFLSGASYNYNFAFNFGSPSYAISSGNADANGYGNFEYAVPSGYYSLNTKNLGEFG